MANFNSGNYNRFPIRADLGNRSESVWDPKKGKYIGYHPSPSHVIFIADNVKIDTPGKTLMIDVRFNPVLSGAFQQNSANMEILIGFHKINDSSYMPHTPNGGNERMNDILDNSWRFVSVYSGQIKGKSFHASEAWVKSVKPAYGWTAANGPIVVDPSEVSELSFSDLNQYLHDKGYKEVNANASSPFVKGDAQFVNYEPWYVGYLSNRGKFSKDKEHIPFVKSSYMNISKSSISKDGGPSGDLIQIHADSEVGEDRYCIVIIQNMKYWVWYNAENDDPNGVNKVDNPLLGIPDWNNNGNNPPVNWPPRYDAHFELKSGGKWNKIEAAGKIKESDWHVF